MRRQARSRRRPIPPLLVLVRPARVGALDRTHPAVLLACAVIASALVHATAVRGLSGLRRRGDGGWASPEPVKVLLVERPPPPRPLQAVAAAPAAGPPRRRLAPASAAPAPDRPRPPLPEPTPTPEPAAPAADTPPLLVPGLALSATTAVGGVGVHVGGGARGGGPSGQPGGPPGEPAGDKQVVAATSLTEEPVFLDNVSAAEMRKYYPEEARKAKVEGDVRVKLLIDDEGRVAGARVLDDPTGMFARAALRVARLYRFKPARMSGRRVATEIVHTIHFVLD